MNINGMAWTYEVLDTMPSEIRELVHEFGPHLVRQFISRGVRPSDVRYLIHEVWAGARGWGQAPKRSLNRGGDRMLDAALAGGNIMTAVQLRSFLGTNNQTIAPFMPTRAMVDASLAETQRHGVIGKERKHSLRIEAALRAHHADMAAR